MDFALAEEQRTFREEVARFARSELNERVIERDREASFSTEGWKRCASFGIQGLPVPIEYGGQGADPLTTLLALESLGYGCTDNGLLFSLNAQMWSCEIPLVRFGTEEQKRRWLPGLCDGSVIGVQAMTEPDTGSDAFALATTARREDGAWVLRGSKTFITNAPVADVFVVFARTNPSGGLAGLSAFLVERGTPGVSVGRPFDKMGLRTSPMSEVTFDDCRVPAASMVGDEGSGMAVFNTSMEWERGCILATAVGAMQRQLERCIRYARERRQFGQAIGKFQAVAHKVVEMKLRLETSRLLLYRLGWLKSTGRTSPMDAALVKIHISESFLHSSLDALQVHGGYGYMAEYELEREVRDAVAGRLYSGTSEVLRNLVAAHLGL
jgi:alkylation response protein AidB-like acyl-CoA dehydrogenase